MNESLKPLTEWHDDPHICLALDLIREGGDPIEKLVEALVGVAERARYAEDYMVIHRMKDKDN